MADLKALFGGGSVPPSGVDPHSPDNMAALAKASMASLTELQRSELAVYFNVGPGMHQPFYFQGYQPPYLDPYSTDPAVVDKQDALNNLAYGRWQQDFANYQTRMRVWDMVYAQRGTVEDIVNLCKMVPEVKGPYTKSQWDTFIRQMGA